MATFRTSIAVPCVPARTTNGLAHLRFQTQAFSMLPVLMNGHALAGDPSPKVVLANGACSLPRTKTRFDSALLFALFQRLVSLVLLWPVLWLQAKHVRRTTPCMPEPPGCRAGTTGHGPMVRLLVAGDSGAAGVGASSQDQALCGQLVRCLSPHHTVQWCVLAANGLDSPGLLKMLEEAPAADFDVVVLSIGANDATGLLNPLPWALWQNRLAELIEERFAPQMLVHSAVPPMHVCLALPQPLRWFMGHWAQQMNETLAAMLPRQSCRSLHWHPPTTTTAGMAMDGIHPSAEGYAAWAECLRRPSAL
jgi:lysophospholipase L1-like esterase